MAVNMTEREQALKELQQLNIELERRVSERTAEADLRATELQESQERLRRILDAAPDAIISMDDQGIIRDVNPATERIFGYVSSELIGQKIQQLVPSYQSVQSADDFIVPREPNRTKERWCCFSDRYKNQSVELDESCRCYHPRHFG